MSRSVLAACLWLLSGTVVSDGQTVTPPQKTLSTPTEWEVRTFSMPLSYWWQVPATRDSDSQSSEEEPVIMPTSPDDATTEQWEKQIRTCSAIISRWCQYNCLEPPKGTLFLFDPSTSTLAMRSTPEWLEEFAGISRRLLDTVPHTLALSLDILQANATTISATVSAIAGKPDHTEALHRLQSLAAQGQATLVRHLQVETRSGKNVVSRAGTDMPEVAGLTVDEIGRIEVQGKRRRVGTMMEVHPILGPDNSTIDVSLSLEHHFAPPEERKAFAGNAGRLGLIESPVTDHRCAKLVTALTMRKGSARLLGVWMPDGTPEFARAEIMQVAFLRADAVPMIPAQNAALAGLLMRLGPTITRGPPDKTKSWEQSIPAGMELRRFKVPPGFLSVAGTAAPAAPIDPFAPAAANPPSSETVGAQAILQSNGILFPEGAKAVFLHATSEIVVVNTRECNDQIDALLNCMCIIRPIQISHALQIIEGDSALIRQLADEARTVADHGALWKRVEQRRAEGVVKSLRIARLESRSGQLASFGAGLERMDVERFAFRAAEKAEAQAQKKVEATGTTSNDKNATKSAMPPADQRLMHLDHEVRMAGTRLEVDPVIGPDGYTVDVNVALEYHYAPPHERTVDAASDDKRLRVTRVGTEFHNAEVRTQLTLSDGMTKLLGVWQPEGAPEFEGKDVMQAAFLKVDLVTIE